MIGALIRDLCTDAPLVLRTLELPVFHTAPLWWSLWGPW